MLDKWVLDITNQEYGMFPVFIPYEKEELILGLTMMTDRCPGELVGVVHLEGKEKVEKWISENPDWYEKYRKKEWK